MCRKEHFSTVGKVQEKQIGLNLIVEQCCVKQLCQQCIKICKTVQKNSTSLHIKGQFIWYDYLNNILNTEWKNKMENIKKTQ